MDCDNRLPPLSSVDNKEVDFRSVVLERVSLGIETLTESRVSKLRNVGYDAFFINLMNSDSKIGRMIYRDLVGIKKIELTNEYIVFHNFRDRLIPASRRKIARLLLDQAVKLI